jgi:hypothetical protein
MLTNLLSNIICTEFTKLFPERFADKAMLIQFGVNIDYDKEDGYRGKDLLIWAKSNYVQVWQRDNWNVISLEDLEDEDDGGPKAGKDYQSGHSEWKFMSDHDSCWRSDGVDQFVFNNRDILTIFRGSFSNWYTLVTPPPELEQLRQLRRR